VKQGLLALPKHQCSTLVSSGPHVALSLVFIVVFCFAFFLYFFSGSFHCLFFNLQLLNISYEKCKMILKNRKFNSCIH
jgi:hypothetical protein